MVIEVKVLTPEEYAALPAHCRELPHIDDENIPEGESDEDEEMDDED